MSMLDPSFPASTCRTIIQSAECELTAVALGAPETCLFRHACVCHAQVDWADQVFNLNQPQHRVRCLLASIAIYRLFAALLRLAPAQSQRAAFYFPIARPNSTYITYFPDREIDARTVVTKEIFRPDAYFAAYGLKFKDLQVGFCASHLLRDILPGPGA